MDKWKRMECQVPMHQATYTVTFEEHALSGNRLARQCPLDNGFHTEQPAESLGSLDALPNECISQILSYLDIKTLTDFRRINRQAMQHIDMIPEYAAIVKYCSMMLRGLLSVETAQNISLQLAFEKLCTPGCEICGDFGPYIWLLTCRRVCFTCSRSSRFLEPISRSLASYTFGLNSKIIKSLPCALSLKGRYRPSDANHFTRYRMRHVLVDVESAHEAGIARHGSEKAIETYREAREEKQQSTTPHNPYTRRFRQTAPIAGRDMFIVRTPFLDLSIQANPMVHDGFHCLGCKCSGERRDRSRMFTPKSFLAHLEEHGSVESRHISEATRTMEGYGYTRFVHVTCNPMADHE